MFDFIYFLQQLVNQPMLGHSEEIAEFLALGGDAHIEFVKKRTDIAPKIDQVGSAPSFFKSLLSDQLFFSSFLIYTFGLSFDQKIVQKMLDECQLCD